MKNLVTSLCMCFWGQPHSAPEPVHHQGDRGQRGGRSTFLRLKGFRLIRGKLNSSSMCNVGVVGGKFLQPLCTQ